MQDDYLRFKLFCFGHFFTAQQPFCTYIFAVTGAATFGRKKFVPNTTGGKHAQHDE